MCEFVIGGKMGIDGSVRSGAVRFRRHFAVRGLPRIGLPLEAYGFLLTPVLTRIETRSRPGWPRPGARLLAGSPAASNRKRAASLDPLLPAGGSVPCTARETRPRPGPIDTARR